MNYSAGQYQDLGADGGFLSLRGPDCEFYFELSLVIYSPRVILDEKCDRIKMVSTKSF